MRRKQEHVDEAETTRRATEPSYEWDREGRSLGEHLITRMEEQIRRLEEHARRLAREAEANE